MKYRIVTNISIGHKAKSVGLEQSEKLLVYATWMLGSGTANSERNNPKPIGYTVL